MENVTVYSTSWCGDCRRTKRILNEKGIAYTEIDIDANPAAADQVISWSGGRRVIPTLKIECISNSTPVILHNPTPNELDRFFPGNHV